MGVKWFPYEVSTYVSLFIYFYIFFGMILLIWHDIDLTWLPPAQTLNVCEGLKKVVNKSPFPLTNVIKKRFQLKKKNWKIDKDGIKKKKAKKKLIIKMHILSEQNKMYEVMLCQ